MPGEPRIPGVRRVLGNPSRKVERDVDDELAFHVESRVLELLAQGVPAETAHRIAEREFGDLRASRRELTAVDRRRRRRERFVSIWDALSQDVRHAARSLRRAPAFSIAAVVTLAIGIGASAAIFAVVDGVLLRPLPYRSPERLVGAWFDLPPLAMKHLPQIASSYLLFQQQAHTIDGIGIYRESEVNVAMPGGSAEPERVANARISASLVPVLGVPPIAGHVFTDPEDRPGAPPVALISEALWRTRFGSDPGIVGRALDVDGVSREIVGVMPATFRFPSPATQVWTPLQMDPVNPPPNAYAFPGIARMKAGVTVADVERDFAALLPRLPEVYPNFVPGISTAAMMDQMHPRPVITPLHEDVTGAVASTLWTVAAAAALVLLVACANVANLTLVRADARQRELAVRAAIGASRTRLLLHFFAESAVMSVVAGLLGLACAAGAVKVLVAAGPIGIPRLAEVRVDATTMLFTLAVSMLVAAACSAVPAIRVVRQRSLALREGGRSGTAGRVQQRLRGGLVAAQIALGLVVLAGSGLLIRTFQRLHEVKPGFDPEHVSTFWTSLPAVRYRGDTAVVRFYSQLVDRVAASPGVQAVGLTSRLPFEVHGVNPNPIYPEDDASFATKLPPLQLLTAVNADYFRAMGIPIIAGKSFDRMETQRDGDAIISRSTALFFWKDSTGNAALGKRFRPLPADPLYTVIGVVGDTRDTALAALPSQAVYFPEAVEATRATLTKRAMALVVRSSGDAALVASAVRQAVRDMDPALPVFDARPMTAVVAAATAQLSFIIAILGAAAAVTLILGAVGLYGVLAYVVTLRRRELGIRIALGASPATVASGMTRYGLSLAAIGVVSGLAVFALVARFLGALLFGVTLADPLALGGASALLLVIALLASWAPARRAARVDPAETLRSE